MIAYLIGASKGLGAEFAQVFSKNCPQFEQIKLLARSSPQFDLSIDPRLHFKSLDLAKVEGQALLLDSLEQDKPSHIFYFAGGGPYGPYASKNWKDHDWAWQVSFISPAKILHWALRCDTPPSQVVVVGSAVAESKPDPNSSSYCAAKHALHGLVSSIWGENPPLDIRLFSPTYLDTDLLPPKAEPRLKAAKIHSAKLAAEELYSWSIKLDSDPHFIF